MRLTRLQLHSLIWEKPVIHLAKDFGLSDVGLAKICRKYGIPLPERGYWARVEAGQKVSKKALPRKDYDPVIEIQDRPAITEAVLLQKQKEKEKQTKIIASIGAVLIPSELVSPHKLTIKTLHYFEGIKKKLERESRMKDRYQLDWKDRAPLADHGRYWCSPQDGFNLKVSLEKLQRALCFLNALIKALEQHGFTINSNRDDQRGQKIVEAVKENEGVRFQLVEGYKVRMLTAQELKIARAQWSFASETTRVPSGIFTFTVSGRESWTEKKFVDGTKRIEDRFPAIIAEFIDLIPRQRQIRIDRAKAEEERRERERRELERRLRRQKQKEQYESAIAESKQLESLERLEAYLQRLETQYISEYGALEGNVAEWLRVVRTIAQSNNPLKERLECLKDLNNYEASQIDWMPK